MRDALHLISALKRPSNKGIVAKDATEEEKSFINRMVTETTNIVEKERQTAPVVQQQPKRIVQTITEEEHHEEPVESREVRTTGGKKTTSTTTTKHTKKRGQGGVEYEEEDTEEWPSLSHTGTPFVPVPVALPKTTEPEAFFTELKKITKESTPEAIGAITEVEEEVRLFDKHYKAGTESGNKFVDSCIKAAKNIAEEEKKSGKQPTTLKMRDALHLISALKRPSNKGIVAKDATEEEKSFINRMVTETTNIVEKERQTAPVVQQQPKRIVQTITEEEHHEEPVETREVRTTGGKKTTTTTTTKYTKKRGQGGVEYEEEDTEEWPSLSHTGTPFVPVPVALPKTTEPEAFFTELKKITKESTPEAIGAITEVEEEVRLFDKHYKAGTESGNKFVDSCIKAAKNIAEEEKKSGKQPTTLKMRDALHLISALKRPSNKGIVAKDATEEEKSFINRMVTETTNIVEKERQTAPVVQQQPKRIVQTITEEEHHEEPVETREVRTTGGKKTTTTTTTKYTKKRGQGGVEYEEEDTEEWPSLSHTGTPFVPVPVALPKTTEPEAFFTELKKITKESTPEAIGAITEVEEEVRLFDKHYKAGTESGNKFVDSCIKAAKNIAEEEKKSGKQPTTLKMRDALHLISALKRPSNKGIVAKDATEEEKSFINRMVTETTNIVEKERQTAPVVQQQPKRIVQTITEEEHHEEPVETREVRTTGGKKTTTTTTTKYTKKRGQGGVEYEEEDTEEWPSLSHTGTPFVPVPVALPKTTEPEAFFTELKKITKESTPEAIGAITEVEEEVRLFDKHYKAGTESGNKFVDSCIKAAKNIAEEEKKSGKQPTTLKMRDALHLISALKRPSNKGIVAKDATEEEKSFINRMVTETTNIVEKERQTAPVVQQQPKRIVQTITEEEHHEEPVETREVRTTGGKKTTTTTTTKYTKKRGQGGVEYEEEDTEEWPSLSHTGTPFVPVPVALPKTTEPEAFFTELKKITKESTPEAIGAITEVEEEVRLFDKHYKAGTESGNKFVDSCIKAAKNIAEEEKKSGKQPTTLKMRDALHLISALKRPSNKGIVAKDATEEEKSFINRMVARLVNLHPTLPTHSTQSVSKTKDHFVKSGTEKGSLHQATIVPTHKEEKSSSHHVQWTTKTHTSHQDLHSQTAWHEESEKHISLRKSSFKGSSHADSAGAGIHGSHKQSNTQRQIEESHVQGDKHVQWSEYEDCSSGNRGRVEHRPTYGKSKVEVVRHYVQEHEKKGHWSSTHQDYKAEGKRTTVINKLYTRYKKVNTLFKAY
jgi:predicted transcriptional regulator